MVMWHIHERFDIRMVMWNIHESFDIRMVMWNVHERFDIRIVMWNIHESFSGMKLPIALNIGLWLLLYSEGKSNTDKLCVLRIQTAICYAFTDHDILW